MQATVGGPRLAGRVVAVAVLVLVAGCGGMPSSDDGGDTPTLTPAPVPDDGPAAVEGVMTDRIDAEAIVANHWAALSNTSYTAVETLRMGTADNATYERRTVKYVAPGGAPFQVEENVTGPVTRVSSLSTDLWWDGEVAYYRRALGGSESAYFDRDDEPADPLTMHGRFAEILSAVSVSSIERGPGDSTIVAGSIENSSVVPRRDGLSVPNNATMTMRIESDGVVSRLAIGYDATDYYDGSQRVRYTYSVVDVGSTEVEPPDWLSAFDGDGGR